VFVVGHEGHVVEEAHGVPLRCVTCNVDLRPRSGASVSAHIECDGDGSCAVDADVHIEIP
jgi:hypothetical protein